MSQSYKKVWSFYPCNHFFHYLCKRKQNFQLFMIIFFKLLGSLALLMFGMKAMSEALQKMAGPQLRHALGAMTTNRFTGLLTGTVVTASVQSSTATTVMTVSFVNAGLLTLAQAISVIVRHFERGLSSLLCRHHPHLHEETPLCGRFPLRSGFPVARSYHAESNG